MGLKWQILFIVIAYGYFFLGIADKIVYICNRICTFQFAYYFAL